MYNMVEVWGSLLGIMAYHSNTFLAHAKGYMEGVVRLGQRPEKLPEAGTTFPEGLSSR